ncbi:pilus assembly protein [Shimia sp. R9_1]|uniref:TadE/TadG family type IV pilus assembly protein n=1 Tax=unclassified Shimia TaxID=2630038 RepID=UPI001ADC3B76|nr:MULTISPECIES: TadE/TadG family type IV pilus assembly protein [unclassified Shimia]MBO9396215.1 pilus assembly protein [Shimia sp. R9_2]MBO9400640.1 pilus assembly protein [Shimia sp. R9_3]MBO9406060.1 pilus assembly protein [Shimia sp. R9_1]
MIRRLANLPRAFRRDEDGSTTIEFVIMVPFFIGLFLSSVELGLMTLRYSYLERSLDMAVRDIRLSTGFTPSHDELVAQVCERASIIPNCESNMKLEMVTRDPRNYVSMDENTICTDRSEATQPVTRFEDGAENDLMVLRACAKVTPIFPTSMIGSALHKDDAGDYALVVMNAFVQEPR